MKKQPLKKSANPAKKKIKPLTAKQRQFNKDAEKELRKRELGKAVKKKTADPGTLHYWPDELHFLINWSHPKAASTAKRLEAKYASLPRQEANAAAYGELKKLGLILPAAVTLQKMADSVEGLIYAIYQSRDLSWRFRKVYANGKIPNHKYSTRSSAIRGAKDDFTATRAMSEFKTVLVKKK